MIKYQYKACVLIRNNDFNTLKISNVHVYDVQTLSYILDITFFIFHF